MPPLATVGPWLLLVAMIGGFGLLNDRFLSVDNGLNILRQASVLLALALGATFVILMGSIDLSVGAIVSLSGMTGAILIRDHGEYAVLLVLLIGLACGAINGLLFSYGRLPSFLVTLGMFFALGGLTFYISQGVSVTVEPGLRLSNVFNGNVGRVPVIALWSGALLVLAMFVAKRTRFGRYMYAIGGGETVAKLSGVPIRRYAFYAFCVSGAIASFGAILFMFRVQSGDPGMGDPFLLPTIAAVVMGGTPLTGGVGGPHRTLLGVVIITLLSNGMDLAGVQPYMQQIVIGASVIVAVALTMDRSRTSLVK